VLLSQLVADLVAARLRQIHLEEHGRGLFPADEVDRVGRRRHVTAREAGAGEVVADEGAVVLVLVDDQDRPMRVRAVLPHRAMPLSPVQPIQTDHD
jgi:hypothetical protein